MKNVLKLSILLNIILIGTCLFMNLKNNWYKKELNLLWIEKYSQQKESRLQKVKKAQEEEREKNQIEIDKNDPVFIFNSKKFPCDLKGSSSYETNLCLGEKLHFVDSLLNVLVKSNLKEFDIEIARNKEGVLKAKDNTYFVNSLKMNIASKENFIKYQKKWEELRELNSEKIQIGCEGGTGCSGIVSSSEIKFVLKRMEEIKK